MPWKDTSPMDERTQFIADYLRHTLSITELCERYQISRKTAYKWIGRYEQDGPSGLDTRSSRPHTSPTLTSSDVVDAVLAARRRHPTWGAKKLLALLSKSDPTRAWPARSTVCDLLSRHDLVGKRRRRRRPGHPGKPGTLITQANEVWCADFKGQFKTRDGRYCYPLTVTDAFSRYLIGCQGLHSTCEAPAMEVFRRLFREYGLPSRIRSDNGVPFATTGLARLSMLSAWWIRLGVLPELIEPGKPQQNGRHERMHRTLKAETTRPPAGSLSAQQRKFNAWRTEYNHQRPHEGIGLEVPASRFEPSPRAYPETMPALEYPEHYERRYVSANGGIRWRSQWLHVSITCVGEYVGLEEVDDGIWHIYYGPLRLGRLLEREMRIEDASGKLWRRARNL